MISTIRRTADTNPFTSRQPGQPEVQPMNRLIRVLRDRRGEVQPAAVGTAVPAVCGRSVRARRRESAAGRAERRSRLCLKCAAQVGAAPQGRDRTAGKRARECRSRGRRSCRVRF